MFKIWNNLNIKVSTKHKIQKEIYPKQSDLKLALKTYKIYLKFITNQTIDHLIYNSPKTRIDLP